MGTQTTKVVTELETMGFTKLTSNQLIDWRGMESFQQCIDLVDVITGDVFQFITTEGTDEMWACDEASFQAYQKNIDITVEL